MPGTFQLTILAPDKRFFDEPVEEVIFDTPQGRIGIMAGHEPMVAAVAEGLINIMAVGGEWKTTAVASPGFVDIRGNAVEFFVDTVEWADEIDTARAQEALLRAEHRMKSGLSRVEFARTQASMSRALARLKAAEAVQNDSET